MNSPDGSTIEVRLVNSIHEVDQAAWNACAGGEQPLLTHGFLAALEDSGSASGETGWLPLHMIAEVDGRLAGVVPMYLKSHSYGEYIFDWAWAEAYERAGGRYYPKLQVAVPFTPVPGPRLLVQPDVPDARTALVQGLMAVASRIDCSSLHVTHCSVADFEELGKMGLMQRTGLQFHWHNRGYGSFEDFLATLKSSKRKMIRKERARVTAQELEIQTLTGSQLTPDVWDHFFPFYRSTVDKRWGSAYLNKRFFKTLGRLMPEQIVLVMARHRGRYVAGALNLLGSDTLYGRNWGCQEEFEFLHFECCYYAAIDFAIERRLARVEAGAQGPHKLQRGYEPVTTYSAHWIRDPRLGRAVREFLGQERLGMMQEMESLRALLPYRQGD